MSPQRPGEAAADRRVLFFGDSFVAGVVDPEGRGWVGRVVAASFRAGVELTAYNLGVRGETSLQVAARWADEVRPRLSPGAECRAVFSFGANDATLQDGRPRVDRQQSLDALALVLDGAASLGMAAFVVGPPPVGEPEHDERLAALSGDFAQLAGRRGVPFVAVLDALRADAAWTTEAAAHDGTHPGAGGYDALARLVLAGGWLDWLR